MPGSRRTRCATAASASCASCAMPASTTACGCSIRKCARDRKSTRLNSSHSQISYAAFCLKKKTDLRRAQRLEFLAADNSADTAQVMTPALAKDLPRHMGARDVWSHVASAHRLDSHRTRFY